ncbi:MAG: L-glutamine--2-deoxy-scyllo-inosose aminotransferase KanB [Bacteroidetes bacterium 46-16]|nr:MAG: L-glutamine--2-deoxy-scyllo-inosose aminotransferase KanB [Bacteroidetes bacterium 46-16]
MPGYELFGDAERKEVNDVLQTGIIPRYGFEAARKGVSKATDLEKAICETFGCKYALLTTSGTTALITALAALGIGAGDEVIIPTFCFAANFEAIIAVGAIPVFVDVNDTLALVPAAIEKAITSHTKAIMPVHMCGSMAPLDELIDLADKYNVLLLEDACLAVGASYKGKYLGTMGHAGVYSFDISKMITCGEGGAIITDNEEVYKRARSFTDHGHDHTDKDRAADPHTYLGYNYRITELHAAVGLAQVRRLPQFLAIQLRNHNIIYEALKDIPGITFRSIPDPGGNTGAYLSFFLSREDIARHTFNELKKAGLKSIYYWYDNNWHYIGNWQHLKSGSWMHRLYEEQKMQVMHYSNQAFPMSDAVMGCCISVGISLLWDETMARDIAGKIASVLQRTAE